MAQEEPRTLLEAEMRERDMSIRALAKKLAGSDDLRQIDKERTNVKRWLDPEKGITDASSERLARVFSRPADYFSRSAPRTRRTARLEELAGDVRDLLSAVADFETRLARLESGRGRRRAAPKHPTKKRA